MSQTNGGELRRAFGKQFQPGQFGNPSGRTRMDRELRVLASQHTEACIARLAQIAGDETIRPEVCLVAIGMLLDCAHGKVQPAVTESDDKNGQINIVIRHFAKPNP